MGGVNNLSADLIRYDSCKEMPKFQKWMRKYQAERNPIIKLIDKIFFVYYRNKNCVEISGNTEMGGLYIGHPFGITINPNVIIGSNCNIHKGVTIGQENRGLRKGCPRIENKVWIGINSTIVGNINIGEDVLIAPNSFVNFDVPPHSIVIGNPGKIIHKENATEGYINNLYEVNDDERND